MTAVISAETMRATLASVRKDPARLASLLLEIAPAQAKGYVLSMHQRAAWDLDTHEIEHWSAVLTELTRQETAALYLDIKGSKH